MPTSNEYSNHSIFAAGEGTDFSYRGPGYVGAYNPEQRKLRVERFLLQRSKRVWTKKVKYDVRKNFADSRLRVKVIYFRY
jgi:hypothetical protein